VEELVCSRVNSPRHLTRRFCTLGPRSLPQKPNTLLSSEVVAACSIYYVGQTRLELDHGRQPSGRITQCARLVQQSPGGVKLVCARRDTTMIAVLADGKMVGQRWLDGRPLHLVGHAMQATILIHTLHGSLCPSQNALRGSALKHESILPSGERPSFPCASPRRFSRLQPCPSFPLSFSCIHYSLLDLLALLHHPSPLLLRVDPGSLITPLTPLTYHTLSIPSAWDPVRAFSYISTPTALPHCIPDARRLPHCSSHPQLDAATFEPL
jgi:hypothetical protein